jgi:hypothetical protein
MATQWGREIWAPGESNGAIPVNVQDQHTRALDLKFLKTTAAITTLSSAASKGDRTIDVTVTTGFIAGVTVGLSTPEGLFYFGEQVGAISGNTVTLDTPLDKDYPAGANAFPASHNMNVDGSTTPQVFQVGPVGLATGISVDITRIMGYIQDDVAMDDAKFGGISKLTNGVVLRVNNAEMQNIWNVKTNGEIGLLCYDSAESQRAPAGSYGIRWRNTYASQGKHGVTLRLDPGYKLEVLIQDDLTGLEDFQMMAQGHYVTD